jgi:uncharacterized membrane protein YhaH (DUF805 family)
MPEILTRPWRRAFSFKGRSTRSEYWLFVAQIFVAYVVWAMLMGGIAGQFADAPLLDALIAISILLFLLFAFVATLTAAVRRLHDHDKTGWLYLITFIPLFGWLFYLIMMLTPGTKGENGYGHDPREGDRPAADEVARVFS